MDLDTIHDSLVNGQRKQMVDQIDEYGFGFWENYKGYLEDRRPNSQGDPYQIASRILKTVAEVPTS